MDGIVDKIVEKYSDDFLKLFPVQKILVLLFIFFLFLMSEHGDYISALESILRLSIKELIELQDILLTITLGSIFFSFVLVAVASFFQKAITKKVTKFLAAGANINRLSERLSIASRGLDLPAEILAKIIEESSERLIIKKGKVALLSSFAEFLFIIALVEILIAVYRWEYPDLMFAFGFLAVWLLVRVNIFFKFISEIMPLEAHISGLKGIPYDVQIEN